MRLAVELSLPVLTTSFFRTWDSNTQPFAYWMNVLTDCATATALYMYICNQRSIFKGVQYIQRAEREQVSA